MTEPNAGMTFPADFAERIRTAMDLLERRTPEKHIINMQTTDCVRGPECGTVACFAGHYAMAKAMESDEDLEWQNIITHDERKTLYHERLIPRYFSYFEDGMTHLKRDLDIQNCHALCVWAGENPDIWGNGYGIDMFASGIAYGVLACDDISMDVIIRHWRGVADRYERAALKSKGESDDN